MATAEQTVSAVLEATNKAYIVETGDSEDGLSHYRRWSDGTIEQWGVYGDGTFSQATTQIRINFLLAFSDTNYAFLPVGTAPDNAKYGWTSSIKKETNGCMVLVMGNSMQDGVIGFSWHAIGK